jgi:hypothetical protein
MKRIIVALLLFAMFAFPSIARADVAPPANPPGSNLQPGTDTTQVRMMAETVVIDVNNDTTPNSLGSAAVTADFTMRNLGSSDESMAVRFPISSDNGFGKYPEITDLSIKVNGNQVSYRRVNYPDVRYGGKSLVPWAEFDVTFPTGQDVAIEVSYNLRGTGYPDEPYVSYYYVLETGAGWKDTIGSADITLRLPYPVDLENTDLDETGFGHTYAGGKIEGNEMRWHLEDFKPEPNGNRDYNIEFALVAPYAWQAVLIERGNVDSNPNDGEAWGRLAKAYKAIFFMHKGYRTDEGGKRLYPLSVEAYEKCLVLLPKDAEWHAGFAELLADRSMWDSGASGATTDTYQALHEIQTALQLSPNDVKVQNIAQEISGMFPNSMTQNGTGYDFVWLTQTPTPWLTPQVTDTLAPQQTPIPPSQPTPTSMPNSSSKSPSPFCGSAALAPLAIAFWAVQKRRHSH